MQHIARFLIAHDRWILLATFAAVWVFGIANWCKNVYRRQNKKFELCRKEVLANSRFAAASIALLTEEYRRQWRAFVNSGAQRPSLVFEFVPLKNKFVCRHLVAVAALTSCAYLAVAIWQGGAHYFVFQAAFWLAFAVVMMVDRQVFCAKQRRAKHIFGRFVAQLNTVDFAAVAEGSLVDNLHNLKHCNPADGMQQAGKLLHSAAGQQRTAEQQRTVNKALNSLLQSYAKNAQTK